MRSIQRLLQRLAKRPAFRVLNDHGRPSERLQRDPVQPNCAAEGENRDGATDAVKHVADAIRPLLVRQTTEIRRADLGGEKSSFA